MPGRLPRNLIKRGDVYYVRVMIDGRRVWRSTGHTTEKSAIRRADELKVQLRNQRDFGKGESPFYSRWAKDYLETYTVKRRAKFRDEKIIRDSVAFFGRYRLDEITRSMCERFLNQRGRKLADSTVNLERAVLQALFERAIEDGLLEKNPFKGIERPRLKPRIRILTTENEMKLRKVLSPRYQRWLTFMLGSGLRIEECRGIDEAEVDFTAGLITVPDEVAKGGHGRQVPLFPEVAAAIRTELKENERLWHYEQHSFRDMLRAKAKKAGIPHISPHDLRHTFATRYLRGGGNIFVLSKILGHSSVKITESTYVHLVSTDIVEMSRDVKLGIAS